MKTFITIGLALFNFAPSLAQESYYLVIGTYTNTNSKGIYVYEYKNGKVIKPVSEMEISNPSYLTVSPNEKYIYAVEEDAGPEGGKVTAFSFNNATGQLTKLNSQSSGGDHPCYVEIDHTGKWVFTGNYSGGNAGIFPIQADGSLGNNSYIITHSGNSIDKERQEKPHVHCTKISPDNKTLLVPDLGIDKVVIYDFNETTGIVQQSKQAFAASAAGAGPRHIDFHPNKKYAYLIEELTGTIQAFKYKKGKLKPIQKVSTLPKDAKGFAGSADIHVSPDGKFLYASNRGDFNNIAIYQIDKKGKLNIAGFQSTLGIAPRNFTIDPSGNFLLVGNQNSDEVVIFSRNVETGLLTDTGDRIKIPKPVCLKWIKKG